MTSGMNMKDMVKALAGMPDDQRQTMMTERLGMFAEMEDKERGDAMQMMMSGVGSLGEADQRKMIKTRTIILAGMPPEKRMKLMKTHMGLMEQMPEKAMAEMQMVQSILPELAKKDREVMQEMMNSMPMPAMGGGGMEEAMTGPGPARTATASAQSKSWWEFWK